MLTTSPTLLDRLRRLDDNAAWDRFVLLYSPLLLWMARRNGFHEADAEDLVQLVFTQVFESMPSYQLGNGQTFRGWLSTIAKHKCIDFRRRRATRALPQGAEMPELTMDPADDKIADAEYKHVLIHRSLDLIRDDFSPETWAAFTGVMVDGRTVAIVAAELGVSSNAVYMARHRVLTRLRQELDGLME